MAWFRFKIMTRLSAALVAVFLLGGCSHVEARTVVAGDSLCVGLAQAAGLKSYARVGAPTREVVSQLRRIEEGATVIVCAGTNDSAAKLAGFNDAVDAVLLEAKKRNQRIIWVGPISTSLWWDRYSDQADTLLALKTKPYVSLRAIGWNRGERAVDHIHLTRNGQLRLWGIIKEKLK